MNQRRSRRIAALFGSAATAALLCPAPAAAQCVIAAEITCGGTGAGGANGPTPAPLPVVGAGGGEGESGPAIDERIDSDISTAGGVPAVDAVSRGGDGGTGGDGLLAGGRGGDGGDGGAITIDLSGDFATTGDFSAGVHLASLGGRGGDSGVTGLISALPPGRGGAGGEILLTTSATVTTAGFATSGIFIESRGGASGNQAALGGGAGALAGAGGRVELLNTGAVTTLGDESRALHAISIGSGGADRVAASLGGGRGGDGGEASVASSGVLDTSGVFAHGVDVFSSGGGGGRGGDTSRVFSTSAGRGGAGGGGGTARATLSGTIVTRGDDSAGGRVESRGGRGGDGGTGSAIFGEGRGGDGGRGGEGGLAAAALDGEIATLRDRAAGLVAMSFGGDGGRADSGSGAAANGGTGGAGGAGGTVEIRASAGASVTTAGSRAHALSALSRGGRGGAGGDASGFVGGAAGGGAGGDGGAIDIASLATLVTTGRDAVGISALSVGGSGGYGGSSGGVIAIGGDGGGGSEGGRIDIVQGGRVTTSGDGGHGVFASSIGGDGGVASGAAGLVAIGGRGGGDGGFACRQDPAGCSNGGTVTVTNRGAIRTGGDLALGILAQSIGGGGGSGSSQTGWLSIGGFGGVGGDGHAVTIANETTGTIVTTGNKAPALLAQSVGGGGGFAGNANGIAIGLAAAIGADAGDGGNGGRVGIVNDAALTTQGYDSPIIQAQSIGGGGGKGGDATSEGASLFTMAIGGSGSAGGDGGLVTVLNRGALTGSLDRSSGILAQSVGRGGGTGGSGYSATALPVIDIGIAVGGRGDGGGRGGHVDVENWGTISVAGDDSRGIFAQSVGGGGGMGGSAAAFTVSDGPKLAFAASVAVGGSGGGGGDGSLVTIRNYGRIETFGDAGHGIQAQSVGGGGGVGGDASAAASAVTVAGSSIALTVAVGGSGGSGGDGGMVEVANAAAVTTLGERAHAIFAQSVGGGGGEGGLGDASAIQLNARAGMLAKFALKTGAKLFKRPAPSFAKGRAIQIAVGVGGKGGAAGDGGKVTVVNSGALATDLYGAHGIFAQSVGGGGGSGGVGLSDATGIPLTAALGAGVGVGGEGGASGDGGAVSVVNTGGIITYGGNAFAILAQSVGGGGGFADTGVDLTGGQGGNGTGTGGFGSLNLSIGGKGGANGDGGAVTIDHSGRIATHGKSAHAIFAQSIGGGGGFGGDASNNIMGKINVAGDGAGEGDGGAVRVAFDGTITTAGAGAFGLLAQSVGGGGGVGGDVTTLPLHVLGFDLAPAVWAGFVQVDGMNGKGGNGGDVIVDGAGAIVTSGAGAHGIFAQSVGGGGGIHGSSLLADFTGVPPEENPQISGVADLIFGSVGNFGTAGRVEVTHRGGISATGDNASAIWAQSVAGMPDAGRRQAGGDIRVEVAGGDYRGGGGSDGAGIRIANGNVNTIVIASDASVSAVSGVAIRITDDAGFARTTISNRGTVAGSVLAGEGVQSDFVNLAGGLFLSGAQVTLKNGALTNAGTIAPGGQGVVRATALTGDFSQSAGGVLDLDIAIGGASDRIAATGAVALSGQVRPTIGSFNSAWAPVIILSGSSVSVSSVSVRDTLAVDWTARTAGPSVVLDARFDFGLRRGNQAGLNADEQALGGHLDAVAIAGGAGLSALLTPLANMTAAVDYKTAVETLTPEPYAAQRWLAVRSTAQFADSVLSCRDGSADAPLRETSCAWLRGSDRSFSADRTAATAGFREDARGVTGGVQFALGGHWVLGAAGGYERADFAQPGRATGATERTLLAGTVKYMRGSFVGSLTLAAALGRADTARIVAAPVSATAFGSGGIDTYLLRLRATYGVAIGQVTIAPRIDFDLNRIHSDAVAETGAGAVALVLPGQSETLLAVTPGVEAGVAFDIGKARVRPLVSASATFHERTRLGATAMLAGAPAGVAPFAAGAELDGPLYSLVGGVEVTGILGAVLRLEYAGRFAGGAEEENVSAKLGWRF